MILNVQMIKGKKFEQQTMQKSKSSFKFLPSAFTCEPQTDETTLKLKKNYHTWINKITTNHSDVLKRLSNLNINKSAGPDMLFPNVLYETRDMRLSPRFNKYLTGKYDNDVTVSIPLCESHPSVCLSVCPSQSDVLSK